MFCANTCSEMRGRIKIVGGGEDALLMAQRSEGKKYAPTLFNYGGFYKIDIVCFVIRYIIVTFYSTSLLPAGSGGRVKSICSSSFSGILPKSMMVVYLKIRSHSDLSINLLPIGINARHLTAPWFDGAHHDTYVFMSSMYRFKPMFIKIIPIPT